jgi:hypothetical protein
LHEIAFTQHKIRTHNEGFLVDFVGVGGLHTQCFGIHADNKPATLNQSTAYNAAAGA